ncbi:MAG: hypothetical protein GX589_06435 [Deltaproteobacteria bacterium]|nr:hypothetical protein [Deltaproteobacteria bacterium]
MPKQACISEASGSDLERVEGYFSELFSQLLETELVCLCKGRGGPAEAGRLSFNFLTRSGAHFSLGFNTQQFNRPQWRTSEYFKRVLGFAGRLEIFQQFSKMRWPYLVEEDSSSGHSIRLYFDLIDSRQGLSRGDFFLSAEEQFLNCEEVCSQDLIRQEQINAIRLNRTKVKAVLSLNFDGQLVPSVKKERLTSPVWLLSAGGSKFGSLFQVSVKALPGRRKLLIAEVIMKTSMSQTFCCSLHLGELEVSAAELLALRPGARIGFKPPHGLEGVLKVAGGDWAKASVTLEGEDVWLEVKELL